jgi:hypothetical protein
MPGESSGFRPLPAEFIEFIRARLAEDETAARDAGLLQWTFRSDDPCEGWPSSVGEAGKPFRLLSCDRENGPHVARHDPLRAMREVEAMRRVADLAAKAHEWTHSSAGATAGYAAAIINDTLRALAVIWADHPDWRPEWRLQNDT